MSYQLNEKPVYLTLGEAAVLIRVSPVWLQRKTRSMGIPHVRLGRQVFYEPDKLLAWVHEHRQPGRMKKRQKKEKTTETIDTN
ncbi:MAG: helix-turn-helix domain-containing protein [Gammaproteobacteria bacterium]|nr:helix-turn-helix domain-containing protein [Gammaproteobacteria bacterium]